MFNYTDLTSEIQFTKDLALLNIKEEINSNRNLLEMITVDSLKNYNVYIKALKDNISEDDKELLSSITVSKKDVYNTTLEMIKNAFALNITLNDEEMLNEDYFMYIETLYGVFVRDYKNTIIKALTKYMLDNKDSLLSNFKLRISKKDSSVIVNDKLMNEDSKLSPDVVIFIDKLNDIISTCINTFTDSELLIDYIIDTYEPFSSESACMEYLFKEENNTYAFTTNDFISKFFKPLEDKETKFIIISLIKNNIINELKKK